VSGVKGGFNLPLLYRIIDKKIDNYYVSRWFIHGWVKVVFTTYLLTTCLWVVSWFKKATELTTMVN
jgi:hypothetical protein